MKPFIHLLALLIITSFSLKAEEAFETRFTQQLTTFIKSLDQEQREQCLLPANDKRRWKMQYTGGKRAGLQIGKLTPEQKVEFEKTIKLVLSEEGWEMATKVAQQDGEVGLNKYYIACFGDPAKDKQFAFRLAEHHLTIVNLILREGNTKEFGPILLGSNPPELWKKDEEALMQLWKDANDPKLLIKGRGAISSRPMPQGDGQAYASLNPKAQKQLEAAWQERLRIFTPPVQATLTRLLKENGGFEAAKVAFYNQAPEQRCINGGKWDFNCQINKLLWDYEGSRGHIHMSLWVKQ
ncbi:DUF3500 domain-containing protein [Rubritalea tangerina]|uniref:DUF3500 domain-containing protein n=1 Tax=Rubritalea tangerina TaxID=430798 RepID=A0ABW4ZBC5_9BACT